MTFVYFEMHFMYFLVYIVACSVYSPPMGVGRYSSVKKSCHPQTLTMYKSVISFEKLLGTLFKVRLLAKHGKIVMTEA